MSQMDQENLPWSVEQRLQFIEFRLFWFAVLNRADLMQTFDISIAQASKDLSYYQIKAPENMDYDKSAKVYRISQKFKPLYYQPAAEEYLSQLSLYKKNHRDSKQGWLPSVPVADSLVMPERKIEVVVLRDVVSAIRQNTVLKVEYQSMNAQKPEAMFREISPHALANDGLRWHTRAYCHSDHKFKDFLLSRCLKSQNTSIEGQDPKTDSVWQEFFEVWLRPNPKLSDGQQAIIAQDYFMTEGVLKVPVRLALLYYFQKRLRLDVHKFLDSPQEQPLVLINETEFEMAIRKANY